MLTLWNLFEASLLCLNAVCVLHEERFMQKMGWGANAPNQGFEDQSSIKFQILNLVRSIRTVTRTPKIFTSAATTLQVCCPILAYYCYGPKKEYIFSEWVKMACPLSSSLVKCYCPGVPLIILNILTIVFKLILG